MSMKLSQTDLCLSVSIQKGADRGFPLFSFAFWGGGGNLQVRRKSTCHYAAEVGRNDGYTRSACLVRKLVFIIPGFLLSQTLFF